jgi:hypothetical protein
MPLSIDEIRAVAADAVAPRHFFVGNGLELEWEHALAENIPWEIYKGRLLDASQTRERRTFEAWNIYSVDEFGRSTEPILSLKLDAETGQLHIVRAILCYAWEAYDAGENVIESRETTKWVRELVGTIRVKSWPTAAEFSTEVTFYLYQAVIGTSRLPLTSLESPLPAFSIGRLAYFRHKNGGEGTPIRWPQVLLEMLLRSFSKRDSSREEKPRMLEAFLRSAHWSEIPGAAVSFFDRLALRVYPKEKQWDSSGEHPAIVLTHLLEGIFNDVALSPYTDLVEQVVRFLRALEERSRLGSVTLVSFWSHLLQQLGRHLTAYDLITFHHRGANYPDALLLDTALKECLRLGEQCPTAFVWTPTAHDDVLASLLKECSRASEQCLPAFAAQIPDVYDIGRKHARIRRRALRQGLLFRRLYEGHLVPDAPTSPGENARVLPAPHVRVPDEQITDPSRRTRRLFEGDSLDEFLGAEARGVLRQSIQDLEDPAELRELGMAIFLDRPFGQGKEPMELDRTPLFSYLAFSRSIALKRLHYLANELALIPDRAQYESYRRRLELLEVPGIPVMDIVRFTRRGIVSLADAHRVAEDFVLIKNTHQTKRQFFQLYDLSFLAKFSRKAWWHKGMLVVPTAPVDDRWANVLAVYDSELRKRAELAFDARAGYCTRRGVELPASSLRVVRIWEMGETTVQLPERDLSAEPILLEPPRW